MTKESNIIIRKIMVLQQQEILVFQKHQASIWHF